LLDSTNDQLKNQKLVFIFDSLPSDQLMTPNQFTKVFAVFLMLILSSLSLIAQSLNVDSALRLIKQSNPDSVNGSIYYDLARNFYASDTKNALIWAQEGAKYFSKTNNHQLMTRCMNLEAVCLFILDNHEESTKLHYNILRIREEKKDTLGIAETLLNIGNIYYRGQDLEQAIIFYKRSREFALKSNNTKLLSSLSNNLGNYYKDKFVENKKDTDKNFAIKYLKEAIYYKEKLKTDRTLEKTYTILAHVYFESKDFNLALIHAKKAEKLALENKNHEGVGSSKMLLCEIAVINKDYELAQSILEDLYLYLGNNKAFHILNFHDESIVVLRNKIRNLQTNSSIISDSLQESNYNTLLLARQKVREELNIKYETDKKELENANLALKNEIAQDKINKIRINSIISLLFVFVLLGLVHKLRKKNKAILKSKNVLNDQANLLNQQNLLLKQSEAFKAKLFSIISHDLKSPINSLKLIVEMSAERQLSKDDYDYLMENMKQELDITSNLLNDLLFWSKAQMESNIIKWSYFNLFNTVSKCLHTLSTNINLKQLKITNHLSSNFIVWGDEMRCEFVIRNILHNAIKYSDFYKEIEIGIKDNGNDWNFYIKDNGVGISKEQLNNMFVSDTSRKSTKGTLNEQGAGIGLLLCHDFIESLGWSLLVNSQEGIGTTFHIVLNKEKMNSKKPTDKLKLASPSHEHQTSITLN